MIIINSKNYLVWGGIAIVVVGALYFLMQGYSKPVDYSQNQAATTQTASPTSVVPTVATTSGETVSKAVVEHKNEAFVPKSITVKVGTTVTFINQENDPMWVASAVHPTHQELPGFDQLLSVGKGGSYSYTFTQKGSWKYHNHLQPSHTGVVVVE